MAHRGRVLCTATLCFLSAGFAYAVPLDVKPGLWERTVVTVSQLASTSPKPDLSGVAPEERKRLEQVMSGGVTADRRTRVTEECVTPSMLEKWSALARDEPVKSCTRTIVTESSKQIKVTLSCGGGQTTGNIEYKASGERLEGKISFVSHEPEFDRVVKHDITSKWMGADCGSVKPLEPGAPASKQLK